MIVHVNDYLVYRTFPGQDTYKPRRTHYKMALDQYGHMRKVKFPQPKAKYDPDHETIFMGIEPLPEKVCHPAPIKKHKHLTERQQHVVLKQIGSEWLKSNGYSNIKLETKLSLAKHTYIRADVYGEKDGCIAIVECGGSKERKLEKASQIVTHIFILPYGFSVPFLWNPSMNLCGTCGHQI